MSAKGFTFDHVGQLIEHGLADVVVVGVHLAVSGAVLLLLLALPRLHLLHLQAGPDGDGAVLLLLLLALLHLRLLPLQAEPDGESIDQPPQSPHHLLVVDRPHRLLHDRAPPPHHLYPCPLLLLDLAPNQA